jgi:hypothetical protein
MTDPKPTNDAWQIVSVWDTRGFFADAIVPTPQSPFKTPYEAAQHVLHGARAGNTQCQAALRQVTLSNAARPTPKGKKK